MPTNPSSPESPTLETLLDELDAAIVAELVAVNTMSAISAEEYSQRRRSSREAVMKYVEELENANAIHLNNLALVELENSRLRSRIAELEAEIKERDEDFGTVEDMNNALIDRLASLEANALTPEEAKALDYVVRKEVYTDSHNWLPDLAEEVERARAKLRLQSDSERKP